MKHIVGILTVIFIILIMTMGVLGFTKQIQARRTRADTAYREGVEAGKSGIPVLACPYSIDDFYIEHWHRGWIKGKLEEE